MNKTLFSFPSISAKKLVYKSEALEDTQEALWEPVVTSLERLCDGDQHCRLMIFVRDDDFARTGAKKNVIGRFQTSFRELLDAAQTGRTFRLERNTSGKSAGILTVKQCEYLDD